MSCYSEAEVKRIVEAVPADSSAILECSLHHPEISSAIREVRGGRAELLFPQAGTPAEDRREAERPLLERWQIGKDAAPYDCLLCCDGAAEVRDHESLLIHFRDAIRPGGKLILTVPNLQNFRTVAMVTEGRWDYFPGTAVARNFLRFFTPKSINQSLQVAGFEHVEIFPLRVSSTADFPRDKDHCVHLDRVQIGPLTDSEYLNYLTESLLIAAQRP